MEAKIKLHLELTDMSMIDKDESFIEHCSTVHTFDEFEELMGFLLAEDIPMYDCVWLIANGDDADGEIIVTENILLSIQWLGTIISDNIYIQQYDSYGDAYSAALTMRDMREIREINEKG